MNIIGTFMDGGTREWVKDASIQILDSSGKPTGQGLVSNSYGSFAVTVPPGSSLLVSHVNYYPVTVATSFFSDGAVLELQRKSTELEGVTVTAVKKKSNVLLWIVGGIVAAKIFKLW